MKNHEDQPKNETKSNGLNHTNGDVSTKTQSYLGRKEQQRTANQKDSFIKSYFGFKTELVWTNIIIISLLHIIAIYAVLTYHWLTDIRSAFFSFVYGVITGYGITAGAHRLWCHRSYKAVLPLRIIILFLYTSCGQYSLADWVRDHRLHHKYTETDADPHDVRRGFFFSHVGWLLMRKLPAVKEKQKTIDISDLYEDPVVAFYMKHFILYTLLASFAVPMIFLSLLGESLYWCFLCSVTRIVILLNMVWSVNSFAHMFGDKSFDRNYQASENVYVSFFAIGEGWHNYHHKFPSDYRASELGYYFNTTTVLLDVLAKLGLAYDMKFANPEIIRKVAQRDGDGSRYKLIKEIAPSAGK